MVFIPIKASMMGGKPRSTTANKVVWGRISIEVNHLSRMLYGISLAEPKVKFKKMSPTDLVEEEENVEAEVEEESRSEKEEESIGKASPEGTSNTHLLPCSAAMLDDLPDKMGDSGVPKVIYDQLNHDSLVPTSLHLQLADQSIRHPVGIVEDSLVGTRNSFMPMDFVVLEMDIYHQIPLILGRPFLSTTGATIDVGARIIEVNINKKWETFTFKPKGTKNCNQVMVTIRLDRNAMTPDKMPSTAKNFATKFSRRFKNATPMRQDL
jgi:hypothetical protein